MGPARHRMAWSPYGPSTRPWCSIGRITGYAHGTTSGRVGRVLDLDDYTLIVVVPADRMP